MQNYQAYKELIVVYSKTCVKWPLSKPIIQDQLLLNTGQKYCRILSTFIKQPFVTEIFVLSIFEWPFYTGPLY